MRPLVWTVFLAAGLGALTVGFLTWRVRAETAVLEQRTAALELRRGPLRDIEERVLHYRAIRQAVEVRRRLVQATRDRQASAVTLLSSLATPLDTRIERVSLTPSGGTIAGTAALPVAASEVGEELQSRGLVQSFEFDGFTNGAYSLSFTLPQTKPLEAGR